MEDERWLSSMAAHAQGHSGAFSPHIGNGQSGFQLGSLLGGTGASANGNALLQNLAQPGGANFLDSLARGHAPLQQGLPFDMPTGNHEADAGSTGEPNSPTQVLLNLLGLLPQQGGNGPSPRFADNGAGDQGAHNGYQNPPLFNRMMDQMPQDVFHDHNANGVMPGAANGYSYGGDADTDTSRFQQALQQVNTGALFGQTHQEQTSNAPRLDDLIAAQRVDPQLASASGYDSTVKHEPQAESYGRRSPPMPGILHGAVHKKPRTNGRGASPGAEAPVRRAGWSADEKRNLTELVDEILPRTPEDWQRVADSLDQPREANTVKQYWQKVLRPELGRNSLAMGGARADADHSPPPGGGRHLPPPLEAYTNAPKEAIGSAPGKHGRRINPRKGIPMHVMATYALMRLPGRQGNLSEMAQEIQKNEFFSRQLDWTARPGTKTYPRWKDALVGCFKPGRYPHLTKTTKKKEGLSIYLLTDEAIIPEKSILKPAMVADVPRAMLPPDFDPDNPLVPLTSGSAAARSGGAAAGAGAAAYAPATALPAPLNTDAFGPLPPVPSLDGTGGGSGGLGGFDFAAMAGGSNGGGPPNLSALEHLASQPGVTPDMIYAALSGGSLGQLSGL